MIETVSIRELHHRTGHYVRRAEKGVLVVTDRGRPVAEIRSLREAAAGPGGSGVAEVPGTYWAKRKLLPGFEKLVASGALRAKAGQKSIDAILAEIKDDRLA
jgi:prevent-host-death family protein